MRCRASSPDDEATTPGVGQNEKKTQERALTLLSQRLGYIFLGDWIDRPASSNIEPELLKARLASQGVSDTLAERALFELQKVANDTSRILYDRKHAVYGLLRCGVKVRPEAGENSVTMRLVNWADLLANDCAVAEEVTVPGGELVSGAKASTKRPTVSVSEGIRQNLDNRKKKYIQPFFSTSVTPQGHPTGDPTDRLERQVLGSLQRRLHGCLVGVGAEPLAYDSDEFTAVEVFLMQLAASMEIDTPAVRP